MLRAKSEGGADVVIQVADALLEPWYAVAVVIDGRTVVAYTGDQYPAADASWYELVMGGHRVGGWTLGPAGWIAGIWDQGEIDGKTLLPASGG